MWQAIIIVFVAVVVSGLLVRGWGLLLRRRAAARLSGAPIVREATGLSLRVLVQATGVLPGMSPRAANRTTGDLRVTRDRLVIACNRGLLVDETIDRGRGLRSVRSTGPGKVVIEGDVARPGRPPDMFRIEVGGLGQPAEWVTALAPWVRAGDDRRTFGTAPVPRAGPSG